MPGTDAHRDAAEDAWRSGFDESGDLPGGDAGQFPGLQLVQPTAKDPPLAHESLGIRAGESLPVPLRDVESATGVETAIPGDIRVGEDSDRWRVRANTPHKTRSLTVRYPRMVRLRQRFDRPQVEDVTATVRETLHTLDLGQVIRSGQTVALTAGSRGIANIPVVLKAIVQLPAATSAPSRSSCRPWAATAAAPPRDSAGPGKLRHHRGLRRRPDSRRRWRSSRSATPPRACRSISTSTPAEADHIGVVARVKPHTSYHGPIESGLFKMMMIGLGKHVGAADVSPHPARAALRPGRPLRRPADAGQGPDRLRPGRRRERATMRRPWSKRPCPPISSRSRSACWSRPSDWLPRLPFHEADLLIIDEIGKEISGSGMDTNVVGRKRAFPVKRAGGPAADALHLRARPVGAHARQRRRHRLRRLHHDAAGAAP